MSGEIDWGNLAIKLFEQGGRKTYHIKDLVELAEAVGSVPAGQTLEEFTRTLNGFLARNVKSKSAQFSKVKNKSGGYRKGFYRIRPQAPLRIEAAQPKVETAYTGAAGEFAVLSELLFRGFNASKMTVDSGIDVVASKDDKYFHIQVKTANESQGKYSATVKANTFQHSSVVFYVVVLRTYTVTRYVNDYVIFSSGEIRRMISQNILGSGISISLRISRDGSRYMLNQKVDVTHHVNDWESIV